MPTGDMPGTSPARVEQKRKADARREAARRRAIPPTTDAIREELNEVPAQTPERSPAARNKAVREGMKNMWPPGGVLPGGPEMGPGYDPSFADPNVQQPLSDDQFLAQHGNTPIGALTPEQRKRRTDIATSRKSLRQQQQQNQTNTRYAQHLQDMASSWPSAQVTGPRGKTFTVGVDSPQHPQHNLYQKAVGWADAGKDPRRVFWDYSAPRTQDASGKIGPRGPSFKPLQHQHPYAKAYQGYMQQHGKAREATESLPAKPEFRYQDIEGYQKPKPQTMTGVPLNLNEPGSVGGPLPGGSVTRTGAPITPSF